MAEEEVDTLDGEVKYVIRDRLKSPLFGSWAIAFCLINWRAIYILLFPDGDFDFMYRLDMVDRVLYSSPEAHAWKIYVLPLTFAIINVAVVPWILVFLNKSRYKADVEMRNEKDRIDEGLNEKQLVIDSLNKQLTEVVKEKSEYEGRARKLDEEMKRVMAQADTMRANYVRRVQAMVHGDTKVRATLQQIRHGRGMNSLTKEMLDVLTEAGLVTNEGGYKLTALGESTLNKSNSPELSP